MGKGEALEGVNILLLDVNPASGLGNSLHQVLERPACVYSHIRSEYIDIREPSADHGRISGIVSTFRPHLAVVVISLDAPEQTGALMRTLMGKLVAVPVMAAFGKDEPDEMVELLKLGVVDFVTPPFRAVDILPRIWRILKHRTEEENLTHILKERVGLRRLVGACPAFLGEINKIPPIARCDASVLITGETGTGKELCARAIHYLSPRSEKPFIPVNCGAIPLDLIENELFGHDRGAYTGADSQQQGLVPEAEGGTLFLDEIDCLPLASQVKLLRLLQDKEYRKLGSPKAHRADIRVIAATNMEIEEATRQGKFRKDLYYRLNIIPMALPPLRERKEDIPLLARHFLERYAVEFHKEIKDFTAEAMVKLLAYEWPGNVRELEHVVQRAVVFSRQTVILSSDILLPERNSGPIEESFQKAKARVVEEFEKEYIQRLLIANRGNISKAARAAEKNRRSFWELIRKHKINMQDFTSRSPLAGQ